MLSFPQVISTHWAGRPAVAASWVQSARPRDDWRQPLQALGVAFTESGRVEEGRRLKALSFSVQRDGGREEAASILFELEEEAKRHAIVDRFNDLCRVEDRADSKGHRLGHIGYGRATTADHVLAEDLAYAVARERWGEVRVLLTQVTEGMADVGDISEARFRYAVERKDVGMIRLYLNVARKIGVPEWRALLIEGELAFAQRDFPDARRHLETVMEAIRINGVDKREKNYLRYRLFRIYLEMGEMGKALEILDQVEQYEGFDRGAYLFHRGLHDERDPSIDEASALGFYTASILADPFRAASHIGAARLYYRGFSSPLQRQSHWSLPLNAAPRLGSLARSEPRGQSTTGLPMVSYAGDLNVRKKLAIELAAAQSLEPIAPDHWQEMGALALSLDQSGLPFMARGILAMTEGALAASLSDQIDLAAFGFAAAHAEGDTRGQALAKSLLEVFLSRGEDPAIGEGADLSAIVGSAYDRVRRDWGGNDPQGALRFAAAYHVLERFVGRGEDGGGHYRPFKERWRNLMQLAYGELPYNRAIELLKGVAFP